MTKTIVVPHHIIEQFIYDSCSITVDSFSLVTPHMEFSWCSRDFRNEKIDCEWQVDVNEELIYEIDDDENFLRSELEDLQSKYDELEVKSISLSDEVKELSQVIENKDHEIAELLKVIAESKRKRFWIW